MDSRFGAGLLVAITALQGLDLATTWLVLGHGGVEANPVSAALMGPGFGAWALLKILLAGAVLACARLVGRAPRREQAVVAAVSLVVAAGLAAAVVGNLWQLAT